jgi:hypothetical protein
MTVRQIYLDLDGVFADFKTRFREIVKFEYDVDPAGAWARLDQVDHLFLTLEPFPEAKQMFNSIINTGVPCKMLTALPRTTGKLKTAAADKAEWVARHLSPEIEVICTDGWRGKRLYGKSDAILIDDMQRNIDDWREGGGIGIRHTDPADTLMQLAAHL